MSTSTTEPRVALVTGSTRGIGWATARALAQDGYRVVLSGRQPSALLDERAQAIAAITGERPLTLAMDVADAGQVTAAYRALFKAHKRLDVLVNNAGVMHTGRLGMLSAQVITRTLAVNTAGALHNLQAAARLMARHGGGSVINLSSILGLQGAPGNTLYSASKAAITGMTRSAARELGPQGVRVNAVAPGFVQTDLTAGFSTDERQAIALGSALGRTATPDDIAGVIVFLASEAAACVTGQIIGVDCGMVV